MKLLVASLMALSLSIMAEAPKKPFTLIAEAPNQPFEVIAKKKKKVKLVVKAPQKLIISKNNSVIMNKPFRSSSVAAVQQRLAELASKTNGDLYLVLNTPGGSVSAGADLIDFANSLPNKVHTITLFAASMGYITAQSLGKRYITPSGTMMSHRAYISGLSGQVPGEALSRVKFIERMVGRFSDNIAQRIGLSTKEYMDLIYDELWLIGNDAVKSNHADEIVLVKCDETLSGTYTTNVDTLFGNYRVSFSRCPIIRGPVKIHSNNPFVRRLVKKYLDYSNYSQFVMTR